MKIPTANYLYTNNGVIHLLTNADLEILKFSDAMETSINDLEAELLKLGFILKSISFDRDGEK